MILKEGLLRCNSISNGTNRSQLKNCSHVTYSSSSSRRCNNSKCSNNSSSSSRAALAMVEALNMEAKLQERKGKEGQ